MGAARRSALPDAEPLAPLRALARGGWWREEGHPFTPLPQVAPCYLGHTLGEPAAERPRRWRLPLEPGARRPGVRPAASEQSKSALASLSGRGRRQRGTQSAEPKAQSLRHLKEEARGAAAGAAARGPLPRRAPQRRARSHSRPRRAPSPAGAAALPSPPSPPLHPHPQRVPLPSSAGFSPCLSPAGGASLYAGRNTPPINKRGC